LIDADQVIGDEKVKKLFGANYRKLQTIKAKYEYVLGFFIHTNAKLINSPNLIFGKWFPIQPLA